LIRIEKLPRGRHWWDVALAILVYKGPIAELDLYTVLEYHYN
jgi:hypothetical protein